MQPTDRQTDGRNDRPTELLHQFRACLNDRMRTHYNKKAVL